jgi:polysaccharide export outer membrane protein
LVNCRVWILPLLILISGCASDRDFGGHSQLTLLDASELPSPGTFEGPGNYDPRIGRFDTIIVDVLGFDTLSDRRLVVDGSGGITLPLVGSVQVGDRTTSEAAEEIARRLRENHVRNPEVAVNFFEMPSNYVTVQGSVGMPGNYPVLQQMTLTRAIAAARGFNEVAKRRDVVVMRTVNGQQYAALYDMTAIEHASYPDPAVYPRDVIIVGESPQRRLFQQLLQAAPLLVSPLVAILQNNN